MESKNKKNVKVWKELKLEIPFDKSKINVNYDENTFTLTVKGEKGELKRVFRYPNVKISVNDDKVIVETKKFSQNLKKIMLTFRAHINNMLKGVVDGFEYKLVVVYAKFPVTVEIKDNVFRVKNLLGEKKPREVKVPEDVKVEIKGKDITVSGIDIEKTGRVAASFEQLTRVLNMDRRVVQDGIYITKKPKKEFS